MTKLHSQVLEAGKVGKIQCFDIDGNFKWEEDEHNLAPQEALIYETGLIAGKTSQITTWYIGLFSGNYTPQPSDTAATIASVSTEFVNYTETTRQLWNVNSPVITTTADNVGNEAVFTCSTAGTIYGCFTISVQAKGSSTPGVCLSVIRFSQSRTLAVGDKIKVGAGLTVISQ